MIVLGNLKGGKITVALSPIECYESIIVTLAGWPSELERCLMCQKVVGSSPGQGTSLGYRFDPQLRCVWEATDRCSSLTSVFSSLSLSNPDTYPQVRKKKKYYCHFIFCMKKIR